MRKKPGNEIVLTQTNYLNAPAETTSRDSSLWDTQHRFDSAMKYIYDTVVGNGEFNVGIAIQQINNIASEAEKAKVRGETLRYNMSAVLQALYFHINDKLTSALFIACATLAQANNDQDLQKADKIVKAIASAQAILGDNHHLLEHKDLRQPGYLKHAKTTFIQRREHIFQEVSKNPELVNFAHEVRAAKDDIDLFFFIEKHHPPELKAYLMQSHALTDETFVKLLETLNETHQQNSTPSNQETKKTNPIIEDDLSEEGTKRALNRFFQEPDRNDDKNLDNKDPDRMTPKGSQ